ncbi:PcfJ domain-containing protein [Candidatus Uabimicrobium amorphum]|uniref:PcfJ-like protein n=1 Tax=Uabimicrobium amorphum TaxID=2596890 RepID=A0A5S9IRW5_UABAM|nr:PcfJ domain-containing protein [Candidatus Uabimicrobium amorphum]BBM86476.1 hypothetical protein UABAM_04862 [Candidatus Uabimicrobium amorphum]
MSQVEILPENPVWDHMKLLKFKSVRAYKNWCHKNCFRSNFDKTTEELAAEYAFFIKKYTKSLRCSIHAIYNKDLNTEHLHTPLLQKIADTLQCENREYMRDVFLHLEKTKLLANEEYTTGIMEILRYHHEWKRCIFEWKPKTRSSHKQFLSLLRHLLIDYNVPQFLLKTFLFPIRKYQPLLLALGRGESIRHHPLLPMPMTKKMVHYFAKTPNSYQIEESFRWAQVRAMGGSSQLVEKLRCTKIMRDYSENEFWTSVVQFFIRHPQLEKHSNPIIDYLHYHKFVNREVHTPEGIKISSPLQPHLSMKGRTPKAILKQVDEWHEQLGRSGVEENVYWKHSCVGDFSYHNEKGFYAIRQLLSKAELIVEGRTLRHCVASYESKCKRNSSTIWTMEFRETEEATPRKLVTIEMNAQKIICQVRGKRNRRMNAEEKSVLNRWCKHQGLVLASYA